MSERADAIKRRALQLAEAVIPRPAANTLGARAVAGANSLMPGSGTYDEELERYNAVAPSGPAAALDVLAATVPAAKAVGLGAKALGKVGALRRADRLAKAGKAAGGFTHPATKRGFAFSASPENEQIVADLTADAIRRYTKVHAAALAKPNAKLGAWYDGEKWYLDVSTVLPDKESALSAAGRAGQRAIYDLAKGESINVP